MAMGVEVIPMRVEVNLHPDGNGAFNTAFKDQNSTEASLLGGLRAGQQDGRMWVVDWWDMHMAIVHLRPVE